MKTVAVLEALLAVTSLVIVVLKVGVDVLALVIYDPCATQHTFDHVVVLQPHVHLQCFSV